MRLRGYYELEKKEEMMKKVIEKDEKDVEIEIRLNKRILSNIVLLWMVKWFFVMVKKFSREIKKVKY